MAITTVAGYYAATKQAIIMSKTTPAGLTAGSYMSCFSVAGSYSTGTLAGTSTTVGVVPDDTIAGYPSITAFGSGNTGYITRLDFSSGINSVPKCGLYDRLFVCGAYSFGANTALSTQPSYSSRVPNTDYKGLEIWVETVTTFTGVATFTVQYTNDGGTTSRSTGSFASASGMTASTCIQLPLQAGDDGVQTISNVQESTASAGTFNVMILRPLGVPTFGYYGGGILYNGPTQDFMATGMPQVYATSALYMLANVAGSIRVSDVVVEISNG